MKKKYNFCLVPHVAKYILELLDLDAAGQRALCGFEPCPHPTGQKDYYRPAFSIGTDACHPGAPSLRGVSVYLGETVGTPKHGQALKLGTIEDLYLAFADGQYYERTVHAPVSSLRAACSVLRAPSPRQGRMQY